MQVVVVVEFCEAADGVGLCGTGRSRILIAVAFVGFTLMQLIERATLYQSYMLLTVGSRFLSRIENNWLRKMPFYFLSVYC
jgi:hypothetical protein